MVPENDKNSAPQGSEPRFSREDEKRADAQMRTDERRKNVRMRQFKGGRILFNKGYGCFDCLIRNISKDGAKLQLDGNVVIPSVIELEVPGDRLSYPCEVIWRTSRELGVRFLAAPQQIGKKHDLKDIFSDPT